MRTSFLALITINNRFYMKSSCDHWPRFLTLHWQPLFRMNSLIYAVGWWRLHFKYEPRSDQNGSVRRDLIQLQHTSVLVILSISSSFSKIVCFHFQNHLSNSSLWKNIADTYFVPLLEFVQSNVSAQCKTGYAISKTLLVKRDVETWTVIFHRFATVHLIHIWIESNAVFYER